MAEHCEMNLLDGPSPAAEPEALFLRKVNSVTPLCLQWIGPGQFLRYLCPDAKYLTSF